MQSGDGLGSGSLRGVAGSGVAAGDGTGVGTGDAATPATGCEGPRFSPPRWPQRSETAATTRRERRETAGRRVTFPFITWNPRPCHWRAGTAPRLALPLCRPAVQSRNGLPLGRALDEDGEPPE